MKLNAAVDSPRHLLNTEIHSTRNLTIQRRPLRFACLALSLLIGCLVPAIAQSDRAGDSKKDLSIASELPALPSAFQSRTIESPAGADIFVRWGGTGPVVVLLHGYAENSDSWARLPMI